MQRYAEYVVRSQSTPGLRVALGGDEEAGQRDERVAPPDAPDADGEVRQAGGDGHRAVLAVAGAQARVERGQRRGALIAAQLQAAEPQCAHERGAFRDEPIAQRQVPVKFLQIQYLNDHMIWSCLLAQSLTQMQDDHAVHRAHD